MAEKVDVLLVGGGVMSATLGVLLRQLDPALEILMVERLDGVALESSDAWNNAGTGHAGYCELNYTPQGADGEVSIPRALAINAAFEVSLQFWTSLVEQGQLPDPAAFIRATPHCSLVWGARDVDFLKRRHRALHHHPLFADMAITDDVGMLRDWMPLAMDGRTVDGPIAATRVSYGTDVDFGVLSRSLVAALSRQPHFELRTGCSVETLGKLRDGRWQVRLASRDGRATKIEAGVVFLGAGGGALPLLQKSGVAEARGYGGFPVSGQWLVCRNADVIRRHHAKVYGKAPLGAPPMSVPHLDTRIIDGRPALLFGPFAGFTTKFLKRGSWLDLFASVGPRNVRSMLAAGAGNLDLTRYLVGEVFQSHEARMDYLRQFCPTASNDDWTLAAAGQRVQVIRNGKLEFGTEIVAAADGSLAALLGASPGASTSTQAMLDVIGCCFRQRLQTPEWQARLGALIPSHGQSLIEDAALLRDVRCRTLAVLGLR